jgi:hypothetical protein
MPADGPLAATGDRAAPDTKTAGLRAPSQGARVFYERGGAADDAHAGYPVVGFHDVLAVVAPGGGMRAATVESRADVA